MAETIELPVRFNGPPASANGGYTCGVVAHLLDTDSAEVSLRSPPPLGRPLAVVRGDGGVELRDDGTLVAQGSPAELLFDVPDPVSVADAREASRAGYARWTSGHPFPTCVVCGPERGEDGFEVYPGPLPDRPGLFAATWTPDPKLAPDGEEVRPECVWAALDCPTSAPVAHFGEGPALVLARLRARIACPVYAGRAHALLAWPLEVDGRKRHSGAALFDEEGRLLAAARALWIELRDTGPGKS